MENTQADGTSETLPRHDQITKSHAEMFKLCEIYLQDCLKIAAQKRIDPNFTFQLDKVKSLYTMIQETREKQ
jgi:hypothetical protein